MVLFAIENWPGTIYDVPMLQCMVASLGNRDRAQGCTYISINLLKERKEAVSTFRIVCTQDPKLTFQFQHTNVRPFRASLSNDHMTSL